MLSNVVSGLKIIEVHAFVSRKNFDLAFITETWRSKRIDDSVVDIPMYSIVRRDKENDNHGGVCLYIKNNDYKHQILHDI